MTKQFLMTSVAALAVGTAPAIAQQTETLDVPANGGQVVVEQADPTVNVEVPDPVVSVDQAAPEVLVEQAQPEIVVSVPEPTVTVQQQAPIITVEQAQPEVTVRIPEPVVTVRMPEPRVAVAEGEPEVSVQQPEPVVRFVRPEPRITIEEAEPRVNIAAAEPQVNVDSADNAEVMIDQAEAEVSIESEGDGAVMVSQADPEVNIEQAEGADVNVAQAEPQVTITDTEMREETERASNEAMNMNRNAYVAFVDVTVADLLGQEVIGERGDVVGEVDSVVKTREGIAAIVGVGGFLGLGEHDIAVPLSQFDYAGGELRLSGMTEEEMEQMPQYNREEVVSMTPDMAIVENL
jgi:hypothetical protein